MNKKIASSLIALILLIVTIVPSLSSVAAAGNSPTMTIGSAKGYRGDNVNIDVTLENNPGFSAASIKIDYDAANLKLNSAELCGEFASGANVSYDNLPYLTFVKSKDSTDSLFLTLNFKILESAEIGNATVSILYDEGDISNTSEEDVNFDIVAGSINIMEKPAAVTGVKLDNDTLSIKTGESKKLTANVEPENASNKTVKWESSRPDVANVDGTGLVTGVAAGNATITVTTEEGDYTAICEVAVECSHRSTKVIPEVKSTCIDYGHSEYTICNDCGEIIDGSDAPLPLENHTYTEKADYEYLFSAATCVDKAVYYKSCSVCGEAGTETFVFGDVEPSNHVGDTYFVGHKDATCTAEGYTGDLYCSDCKQLISNGSAIPMIEHTYGEWTVTKAPTCLAAGEKTSSCTVCGKEFTEEVPATGHKFGEWTVVKDATEDEEGLKEHTCTVCGEKETEVILKLTAQENTETAASTTKAPSSTNGNNAKTSAVKSPNTGNDTVFYIYLASMMLTLSLAIIVVRKRKTF